MCLRRDFRPASSFIFFTFHAFTLLFVNSFIIVTREAMCHRCESRPPAALLRVTLQACNQPPLARVPECHHDSSVSSFSHKLRFIYLQPHPARVPLHSAVVCSSWGFQRPSRIAKASSQIWKGDHMLALIGVDRWVHFNSKS